MKTMDNTITGDRKSNVSLQELVDVIIKKPLTAKSGSRIHIQNNVAPDLYISTNEDTVASVVEGMLNSMMTNAADGDIDISAKELFSNTIKLSIRDNNCYNTYAVACSLQNLVPLTEQIGGYLNITNQKQKITTIEFSFPVAKDEAKQDDEN